MTAKQQSRGGGSSALPLFILASSSLHSIISTLESIPLAQSASVSAENPQNLFPLEYGNNPRRQALELFQIPQSDATRYSTACPDLDWITGPLYQADMSGDGNRVVSQEEFVTFADAVSGGLLTSIGKADSFLDMPLVLQETYLVLSCLCEYYPGQPWGGDKCCTTVDGNMKKEEIGIRTDGTAPDETLTKVMKDYYRYVCGTMSESLEKIPGGSLVAPPTRAPTSAPTSSPTPQPSPKPTKKPTASPTVSPTISPTEEPSPSPSRSPVNVPTTPLPTEAPTAVPTGNPNTPPTGSPVKAETGSPSLSPDASGAPTIEVPNEPTSSPILIPPIITDIPTVTSSLPPTDVAVPSVPTPPPSGSPISPTFSPKPTLSFPPTTTTESPASVPTQPTVSPAPSTETKAPVEPTTSPIAAIETTSPVSVPLAPTPSPGTAMPTTSSPTLSPTISSPPTTSPAPSEVPSVSSAPTISAAPISPTSSPTLLPTAKEVSSEPTTKASVSPTTIFPTTSPGKPTTSPRPTTMTPTEFPTTAVPTQSPSESSAPSLSTMPSGAPTISSVPSTSSAPSAPTSSPTSNPTNEPFSGEVPVSIEFIESLQGQVTAQEVMDGTTNQVKVILEEALYELSAEVVAENFSRRLAVRLGVGSQNRRRLVVEPWNATVDNVVDVACPEGLPSGAEPESPCLDFKNTIILVLFEEPNKDAVIQQFEDAMNQKISEGWLVENFDLEQALRPPPTPTPTPVNNPDGANKPVDDNLDSRELSAGAIAGIVIAAVALAYGIVLSAIYNRKRNKIDDEVDLERQSVTDSAIVQDLGRSGNGNNMAKDVNDSWSVADSEANTESNTSQDHLLSAAISSSGLAPALGKLDDESESDFSEMDSVYSSSMSSAPVEDPELIKSSPLAAVAMASTLVASQTSSAPSSSTTSHPVDASGSSDVPIDNTESSLAAVPGVASPPTATGGETGGIVGASPSGDGGLSAGATAAIVTTTVGAMAAGAYAATRTPRKEHQQDENETGKLPDDLASPSKNLDELDAAIEAGNWGAVGALAATMAAEGRSLPQSEKKVRSVASIKSEESGRSGSRGSSTGPSTLDQARAQEIDKLVETGDWQGVVLAAARFEADQTMDGESYSASASQSSRWTGSASSAVTPRSMATTDQSSTNISSGRSQAEIRAEVEALVRRVVPEEADNVDEMLTQFKGREEELVETLRRMQERAIASRARLAVQKSAKLEARARATSPGPGVLRGSASIGSGSFAGSAASRKSELEQAIETGNWEAVGEAAQRMSDNSVGSLSVDERARMKEAISRSPGFSTPGSQNEEYNLDQLIERGDWPGVIAAAKKASETSDHGLGNMTKEEQEALAQANMWQEIANQSKQEGRQDPAGAGDAAAWAIQRSLHALNTPDSKQTPIRTIDDIADEESSEASQYESSSYSQSASKSYNAEDYRRGI